MLHLFLFKMELCSSEHSFRVLLQLSEHICRSNLMRHICYIYLPVIFSDSVWNVSMQFQEEETSDHNDGDSGISFCGLLGPFPRDSHDDRIQ